MPLEIEEVRLTKPQIDPAEKLADRLNDAFRILQAMVEEYSEILRRTSSTISGYRVRSDDQIFDVICISCADKLFVVAAGQRAPLPSGSFSYNRPR